MLGNSFTLWNEMPARLATLSGAEVVVNGQNGFVLSKQLDSSNAIGAKTLTDLNGGDWDYVIIQEYSTRPITSYSTYLSSLRKLTTLARQTGATPIIYGTWAYDKDMNGKTAEGLAADKVMHRKLQTAFSNASKSTSTVVANVGAEFARLQFASKLYNADGKHASYYGSGICAQVINDTIKALQKR